MQGQPAQTGAGQGEGEEGGPRRDRARRREATQSDAAQEKPSPERAETRAELPASQRSGPAQVRQGREQQYTR